MTHLLRPSILSRLRGVLSRAASTYIKYAFGDPPSAPPQIRFGLTALATVRISGRTLNAGNGRWRPHGFVLLAAIAFAVVGCGGSGGNGADGDAEEDLVVDQDGMETTEEIDLPNDNGEGLEQPLDSEEEDILSEDVDEEEEEVGPGCGNGIIEGPEVCDDGNRVTEFCGRWEDCLGDCSLLQADCGNGDVDEGEECDDGNADSMDDCTTSCNINDHGIGAPCECPNCYGLDVVNGPIYGCENVEIPPGSGGELACPHTLVEDYSGYMFHAPEGYCMIYALSCTGDESECEAVVQIGDIETFACPPDYPMFGVSCQGEGRYVIEIRACMRPCDSPAHCRWNAYDEELDDCGQMDCIETPSGYRGCFDARNYFIPMPDLECEFL